MATEVGTMERKRALVTHDLLGGASSIGSNSDLDLSLKVSSGRETRFELLSHGHGPSTRGLQGLNLLPQHGSSALELKLMGAHAAPAPNRTAPSGYASVCTIDKVKTALERARRVPPGRPRAPADQLRRISDGASPSSSTSRSSSSSSSITSSTSVKRRVQEEEAADERGDGCDSSSGALMAAGCPRCLMYVLISKANPRCPRCDSHVPVPVLQKRPRIDLNFSLGH